MGPPVEDTAVEDTAERKSRGAFYTPDPLCDYVAAWALREPTDRVLEPSCGQAAFLLAAERRLRQLGALEPALVGVEVHPDTAATARNRLHGAGPRASVRTADFFATPADPRFDVVVGNPPYVRYQDFSGPARASARRVALQAGVPLTRLASSWAAFTVHASQFLRPGGRLGLVLPAELLSVNYAAEVRSFLMRRFGRVRLVLFTERVFPGVLAEVVLLLAEGEGPTDHCELVQVPDIAGLTAAPGAQRRWSPPTAIDGAGAAAKWTTALLPDPARDAFESAVAAPGFAALHEWGETTLGAVTGNNTWFTLTRDQLDEQGLGPAEVLPLSPPGSRHLRALTYTAGAWRRQGELGASAWLFRPTGEPSAAAARRIAAGERAGVPAAYKCRVRDPWWRVPVVPPADLLLTYMNADCPQLCTNRAGVHHLNSVHGVYLRPGLRRCGSDLLPLAALNTITLTGAEIVGRAYGGGLLKLEPREADRLPVPSPELLDAAGPDLRALRAPVSRALAAGERERATAMVDAVLLRHSPGLGADDLNHLSTGREFLRGRRLARSRRA